MRDIAKASEHPVYSALLSVRVTRDSDSPTQLVQVKIGSGRVPHDSNRIEQSTYYHHPPELKRKSDSPTESVQVKLGAWSHMT